jgi:hypothetical protein
MIAVFEWEKTFRALDRAATVIGTGEINGLQKAQIL